MKKAFLLLFICLLIPFFSVNTATSATFADVTFVVDQSGSMSGEFAWIANSIAQIDIGLQNAGITTKYGLAGYEYNAGSAYYKNAWVDLPSTIGAVTAAANWARTNLYGGTERGYHAADWAADNFSWSGSSYAKIMILITDEPNDYRSSYAYDGLTGEAAIAKKMADENILLNVITFQNYFQYWDDVAYKNGDYAGLFDLNYLKNNPTGFTDNFITAKTAEIINHPTNPVPEPATMMLFGLGLLGLAGMNRRKN